MEFSNCLDFSIQDWMIVCSVVSFCVRAWFLRTRKHQNTPTLLWLDLTVWTTLKIDLRWCVCVLFFCDFYASWLVKEIYQQMCSYGSWIYHRHAAFKTSSTGFCFRPCAPIGDMPSRFIGFKIKSRMVTTMST